MNARAKPADLKLSNRFRWMGILVSSIAVYSYSYTFRPCDFRLCDFLWILFKLYLQR